MGSSSSTSYGAASDFHDISAGRTRQRPSSLERRHTRIFEGGSEERSLQEDVTKSLAFMHVVERWLVEHEELGLHPDEERYFRLNLTRAIALLSSPLLHKVVTRFEATHQLIDTVQSVKDNDMSDYLISGYASSLRRADVSVYSRDVQRSLRGKLDRAFHKIKGVRMMMSSGNSAL